MFSVGCFGYGGNVTLVELFREELELANIQLKTCHEYPSATIPYNPDTIHQFIDSCDVILLPARVKLQPAKSVNRLALAWSRRKACVISPLPAYLDYAVDNINALVADSKEEWLTAIFKLRDDLNLRNQLAASGFDTAIKKLHPRQYVDRFVNALSQKGLLNPWPVDTFIQVIIPHYAPRLDYLKLAVESVLSAEGPPRSILVVSSSQNDPTWLLEGFNDKCKNVRVLRSANRLSFSEANNLGIKNCDKRTTHFLLLNDDSIVGKNCLIAMLMRLVKEGNCFLLNPYSNCDRNWLHFDKLTVKVSGKELIPNMQIEGFSKEELENLKEGFNSPMEIRGDKLDTPFCAMYCTMIPKGVVDRVGFLSTLFKNGGEDLDYCERAKRMGFGSYWDMAAECFHFGGKTRKVAEGENFLEYHKEDTFNNLLARARWPKGKKRIGIWTGPAWEQWDLDNYREFTTDPDGNKIAGKGIGGSEYVEGCLAEAAAAAGHHVTLYTCIGERKTQYGVDLVPWNEFIPEEEYFDLFIASRNLNCIDSRLRATKVLAHIHDIFCISGKHISDFHRQRIDKFICLSPWHVDFFSEYHAIPKDKIIVIPNGVKVEYFNYGQKWEEIISEKIYGKMIYSSSPDRGLDNLLYLMPYIKDHVPELHVDIYYGFHNYESSVRSRNNAWEVEQLEKLKEQIDKSKDFAFLKGRVNQVELSRAWMKTYLWGYPTNFTESYCITAKEAQLSATPILTSNVAALQTTVGEYGIRIEEHPYSKESRQRFIDEVVKLFKNKDYWIEWSKKSFEGAKGISWKNRWEDYWSKWI